MCHCCSHLAKTGCLMTWLILQAELSDEHNCQIPSWQISTAHAQPFRGARDLAFCLKVPLDLMLVWASSEGSGETARMRRLAWTFAARIGDKNQIRLAWPKSKICMYLNCLVRSYTTSLSFPLTSGSFRSHAKSVFFSGIISVNLEFVMQGNCYTWGFLTCCKSFTEQCFCYKC